MTNAATPASSGVDWLVPPNASIDEGAPLNGSALKSAHSEYTVFCGVHNAQSASAGETKAGVEAFWLKPPPAIEEMLSFSQVPLENWNPYDVVCAYWRKLVLPPESITNGSVAGSDGLAVAPESLDPCETTTPDRTAASLNSLMRSRAVSGMVKSPNDSLSTSAWSCVTAQSSPWTITEPNAP